MESKHTPGPWTIQAGTYKGWGQTEICTVYGVETMPTQDGLGANYCTVLGTALDHSDSTAEYHKRKTANASLIAAAPDLLEALKEGRRAIGNHYAPSDCYTTGPLTGDPIRDLVQCPACCFIHMYDAAIAKAEGQS